MYMKRVRTQDIKKKVIYYCKDKRAFVEKKILPNINEGNIQTKHKRQKKDDGDILRKG